MQSNAAASGDPLGWPCSHPAMPRIPRVGGNGQRSALLDYPLVFSVNTSSPSLTLIRAFPQAKGKKKKPRKQRLKKKPTQYFLWELFDRFPVAKVAAHHTATPIIGRAGPECGWSLTADQMAFWPVICDCPFFLIPTLRSPFPSEAKAKKNNKKWPRPMDSLGQRPMRCQASQTERNHFGHKHLRGG
jgi:hypothetical protein